MTIDIDPIAFSVGGIAIRWYGLLVVGRLASHRSVAFRRSGAVT